MKVEGGIRRLDDLGRIVIPKEIRRKVGAVEGTPMEVLLVSDEIILKKHKPDGDLLDAVAGLSAVLDYSAADLEKEKASAIRKRVNEIMSLLKQEGAEKV